MDLIKGEVIKIIKTKIAEHRHEMDMSRLTNETIQRDIDRAKENLQLDRKAAMMSASKLMVLKDKAMFHKACIAALEDVLADVEKLTSVRDIKDLGTIEIKDGLDD